MGFLVDADRNMSCHARLVEFRLGQECCCYVCGGGDSSSVVEGDDE